MTSIGDLIYATNDPIEVLRRDLGRLSETQRAIAGLRSVDPLREIAEAAGPFFSTTTVDLVLSAWEKRATIRRAKADSVRNPGVDKVVHLEEHAIDAAQRLEVFAQYNRVRKKIFDIAITVELVLLGLDVYVRDGRIVGCATGHVRSAASLAVVVKRRAHTIARREADVPLPATSHSARSHRSGP